VVNRSNRNFVFSISDLSAGFFTPHIPKSKLLNSPICAVGSKKRLMDFRPSGFAYSKMRKRGLTKGCRAISSKLLTHHRARMAWKGIVCVQTGAAGGLRKLERNLLLIKAAYLPGAKSGCPIALVTL
jgi:hypothetical protein